MYKEQVAVAADAARAERHSTASSCPNLFDWARQAVAKQLEHWSSTGISEEMHKVTRRYKIRSFPPSEIRVQDGNVTGGKSWAEYMRRAIQNWPFPKEDLKNFKVWAEFGDWPYLLNGDPEADMSAPTFVNSNNNMFRSIMMPVESRPQYLNKYVKIRQDTLDLAKKYPFKNRMDKAVWRGALGCSVGCGPRGAAYYPNNHLDKCYDDMRHWDPNKIGMPYGCAESTESKTDAWTNHPRFRLSSYNAICGQECNLDAAMGRLKSDHRGFVSKAIGSDTTPWEAAKFMSDTDTAKNRYVFLVSNNGYSDRSWRMFGLGNVVLKHENGWDEWYFSLLKPWVHYVPLRVDLDDTCSALSWLRENPEEAELIAAKGFSIIDECMDLRMVDIYVAEVIRQLGALWELGHRSAETNSPESR